MGIRHLSRQRALQLLYAMEFAGPEESFRDVELRFLNVQPLYRRGWGPFARELAERVWTERAGLDQAIAPLLRGWTLERLPRIDRLCLRMALAEMRHFPDIPLRVTLNEYIDLVRAFSVDESPQYINAVLDRLAKDFAHKDFQSTEEAQASQPIPNGES